ncbi:MAG: hypothetical protein NC299_16850 [Lachnospiraceae bacterium]|nr:hypothetical protein [Ruminococcus sp.]MCM1277003.1 hypothetical protein [Lachnospiraceae bacterium]
MKKIKVEFKGQTPLLMHSCQCVNPLHPITRKLKEYTSKRTKTEEDLVAISDLEWEGGLYYDEQVGIYIPVENIQATIINGAKANKNGKDIERYCEILDFQIPLDYGCDKTKDELMKDERFRDVRAVNVMRAKVMRTRPRFNKWSLEFTMRYNEEKIDLAVICQAIEYAGSYVGLCDCRPKYGKFTAVITELD